MSDQQIKENRHALGIFQTRAYEIAAANNIVMTSFKIINNLNGLFLQVIGHDRKTKHFSDVYAEVAISEENLNRV